MAVDTGGAGLEMSSKRRKPTLAEIAKVADVSLMTASRAINNRSGVSPEKREEILRISEDLGYVPNRAAQRLSGGRSHVVGVIAPLHSSYSSELVLGIGSAGRVANYEMLVYSISTPSHEPPPAVIDLLAQVADGVIVVLPIEGKYLSRLAEASLPVVTIDEGPPLPFPKVVVDNYRGGRMALDYLASLGHRRIGFISGEARLASVKDRLRAFRDGRIALDLDLDEDLVSQGDSMQQGGFEATNRLLSLEKRPTAIFTGNDVGAVGALAAIRESGLRVPEDISLIGCDDIPLARQVYPNLTTIRHPLAQMSRAAVNMLIAMISGFDPPTDTIVFPPELIVRDSTTAPAELVVL
jgi:LacI family transcriptional regulator